MQYVLLTAVGLVYFTSGIDDGGSHFEMSAFNCHYQSGSVRCRPRHPCPLFEQQCRNRGSAVFIIRSCKGGCSQSGQWSIFTSVFFIYFRSSIQKDTDGFNVRKVAGKMKRGTIIIHTVFIVRSNFPESLMYLGFRISMLIHVVYFVTCYHSLSLLLVH